MKNKILAKIIKKAESELYQSIKKVFSHNEDKLFDLFKNEFVGFSSFFEERELAEILCEKVNIKGCQAYSSTRHDLHVVLNVKGKGLTDYGEIVTYIAKKENKSVSEVKQNVSEERIQSIWDNEVSDFHRMMEEDLNIDIGVLGRSGGYWGFPFKEDMLELNPSFLNKIKTIIFENVSNIAEELLDRADVSNTQLLVLEDDVIPEADILDYLEDIVVDVARNRSDDLYAIKFEDSDIKVSPEFEKKLQTLNKEIISEAKTLEDPDFYYEYLKQDDFFKKEANFEETINNPYIINFARKQFKNDKNKMEWFLDLYTEASGNNYTFSQLNKHKENIDKYLNRYSKNYKQLDLEELLKGLQFMYKHDKEYKEEMLHYLN